MGKKDGGLTCQSRRCRCHCWGRRSCQVGERMRDKEYLRMILWWEVVNGIDNRVMVTASCSVNKDEVKELSASGEFKGGAIFCARLEALRDRQWQGRYRGCVKV